MNNFTQEQIKEIVRKFDNEYRYNCPELNFNDYLESLHLNTGYEPLTDNEIFDISQKWWEFLS